MNGDAMSDGVASDEEDENNDTPHFSNMEEEPVNESHCASETCDVSKVNDNCVIPENMQLVLWKPHSRDRETASYVAEIPSTTTNDCCSEADSVVLRKGGKRWFPWRSELFSLLCSFGIPFVTLVLEMGLLGFSNDFPKSTYRLVYLLFALMQIRVIWRLCRCKVRKLPYFNPPPVSSTLFRRNHGLSDFGTPAPYLSITMVDNTWIRLLIWSFLLSIRFLALIFCTGCLFLSFAAVTWSETSLLSSDSNLYAPELNSFQQQCQSISKMLLSPIYD